MANKHPPAMNTNPNQLRILTTMGYLA